MNTYFLQRGDLLFLTNYEEEDIRVGEIVVFKIDGRDIPIVHRFDPILENLIPLSVQSVEAPREGGRLDQIPHKGEKQHSSVSLPTSIFSTWLCQLQGSLFFVISGETSL